MCLYCVFPFWWIIVSTYHVFCSYKFKSIFLGITDIILSYYENLFHSLIFFPSNVSDVILYYTDIFKVYLLKPVICQSFCLDCVRVLIAENIIILLQIYKHFILFSTRLSYNFELLSTSNLLENDFACPLMYGHKLIFLPNILILSILSSNLLIRC